MSTRPNILLITTDQQRFDTIAAGGNPHIRTPHLDWLLESGIHFTRAYTDSPVCVPARATLLTGRHYINLQPGFGYWGQPTTDAPDDTLPARLRRAGYQTKSVGKLHHTPIREGYGWEDAEILQDYYREMRAHPERGSPSAHGLGQNEMQPAISTVEERHSLTHWTVDRAIAFLEQRDRSRPFLLNLGFTKPHPPFDPCLAYWLQYQNASMPAPLRGDWSADPAQIAPGWFGPTWLLNGADRFSPELIRDIRRAYYALITQIDYNLGLLFSRLRERGELDNTLILFTSDHGEMLGDHHLGAKTLFLEGAAHVPLLVRPPFGPGHERYAGLRGTRCDALACLADVLATCTAAADADPGAAHDGLDLIALARGDTAPRERLFGWCADFTAVIEKRYKYIFTESGGSELLFDLQTDPGECRNLIGDTAHVAIHRRLRATLAARLHAAGHPCAATGELQPTRPAPTRQQLRVNAWPGFHHPDHTEDDLLH